MSEYSLHDYGRLIRDRVRTDAYAQALEQLVQPDSVVLDIGTGSGMFAMLAARSGARRVFAVEETGMIELARELAAKNGFADQITFVHGLSTKIVLPERVDLIVSDLRGILPLYKAHILPLYKAHIPSIADARHRHLAEGGALIPFLETLWAAPVELADAYDDSVSSWGARACGLDISAARAFAANALRKISAPADAVLGDPVRLAVLDYRSISSPNVKSSAELEVTRPGTLHGMVVWFDSELAEGVGFSNAPGKPKTIYSQAFFPLLEPVSVIVGDVVSLAFSASLMGDDYIFRWDTRITDGSDPSRIKGAFDQSTLFASPLTPDSLATREEKYAPTPTEEGKVVAFVLEHADGGRTLGDLSREVEGRFSGFFDSADEALRFVTEVTQKYCR